MYLESRTKKIFAIACLEKKFVFQSEICEYFEYLISKIGLFHRVKELFKSNQTRYGVSRVYLESRTKRIFAIACLEKKVLISIGNVQLFAYYIFKNIKILDFENIEISIFFFENIEISIFSKI